MENDIVSTVIQMNRIEKWANAIGIESFGVYVFPLGFKIPNEDEPFSIDLSSIHHEKFLDYTMKKVFEFGQETGKNKV